VYVNTYPGALCCWHEGPTINVHIFSLRICCVYLVHIRATSAVNTGSWRYWVMTIVCRNPDLVTGKNSFFRWCVCWYTYPTYIYKHMFVGIHTLHICTNICTYINKYIHAYMYIYVSICTCERGSSTQIWNSVVSARLNMCEVELYIYVYMCESVLKHLHICVWSIIAYLCYYVCVHVRVCTSYGCFCFGECHLPSLCVFLSDNHFRAVRTK